MHLLLQVTVVDLRLDPWEQLVQDGLQRSVGFKAQHLLGLLAVGNAALDVILEWRVRLHTERLGSFVVFVPNQLGQLQDRGRSRRGDVEVVVQGIGVLNADADARARSPP